MLEVLGKHRGSKEQDSAEIYKMLDGNYFEREVFKRYPYLEPRVKDLKHNDEQDIDEEFKLRTLYTPGHTTDHVSLLLSPKHSPSPLPSPLPANLHSYLFSGDLILGTPSTSVQEMSSYMQSLYSLRHESFDHICLPHSVDMNPESIVVHGRDKLEAYIRYREEREQAIVKCFDSA